MNHVSPGQARVRQLTTSLLGAYEQARSTTSYEDRHRILARLRARLARDSVVRSDYITGKPLGYHNVSYTYLRWLREHSHTVAETAASEKIELDHFVYTRPSDGRILWYAFSGGHKWNTTMSVLFALALNRSVHTMNLDAYCFRHSGVLALGSGGNHRMLA